MLFIDDAGIFRILQRLIAVHFADLLSKSNYKFILYSAIHEYIVRSHTGLPRVYKFAESNTAGGDPQRGALVHDAGALTSQLQRHRRQCLCSFLHDQLTDSLTSSKEDIIKFFLQDLFIHGSSAGDYGYIFLRESFGYDLIQDFRRMRRIGRRLDHATVAGCDRPDQRLKSQKERVIPRRHD